MASIQEEDERVLWFVEFKALLPFKSKIDSLLVYSIYENRKRVKAKITTKTTEFTRGCWVYKANMCTELKMIYC
jgi:hypothetical protein